MRVFWFLALFQSILFAEPSYLSFPSDISWKSIESDHFHIIYREGQKDFAKRTLKAAERAHGLLTPVFPEAPPLTSIVLADFRDSLNGYSLNFPYPHFVIFASPPDSTNELSSLDHWLESVVLHEYAHTLHLYPANGAWKWLHKIFGTWVVPNGMMPSHLHEGLATFLETHFSQGGRGRSPFFKMLSRKAVEKNLWGSEFLPVDLLDGSPSIWPHGASPYYFGFYFYDFLWSKKGLKGIYDLTRVASSNWPYLINSPYQDVFESNISDLWKEISEEQIRKQKIENKQILLEPLSELSYLTKTKFTKKELVLAPSKQQAAFLSSSPDKSSQLEIMEIPSGKILQEHSIRFSSAGGLCWKEHKNLNLFLLAIPHDSNLYSTNRLAVFSPDKKQIFDVKDQRGPIEHIHEFSCSSLSNTYLVFQEIAGSGKLTIYEETGTFPQSEFVSKFEWKIPTNTWISSVSIGETNLFLLRDGIETGLYEWSPPSMPKLLGKVKGHAYGLKRQGKQIYFIAPISGRDEIWQVDVNNKKLQKVVSVSGGINHFIATENQFVVSSYEHGGFDIALATPVTKRIVSSFLAGEPPSSSEEATPTWEEKDYSPLSYLVPRTWIPSALFVPYGFQIGAWIPMFDLSQKHFYDLNFGLDKRETTEGTKTLPTFSGLYGYRFGEASSFQTSTYFSPGFLIFSRSFFKRWGASLSYATAISRLPIQGKISALLRKIEPSELGPANQSVGVGIELGWSSKNKANVLDTELTDGLKVSLNHQHFFKNLGSMDNYFSSLVNMEAFVKSPIWNSARWYLSLRQGYTEGTPLYNSFFEGGGELLFSQGRGFFLNRGYLPGSFAARRIFGGNLEFRFPVARVDRGIGLWPAFLENISGALVLDSTSYDRGLQSTFRKAWLKEFFWSAGVELKSQWRLFYYLPTQIRLGTYRGLSPGGEAFYFTLGVEASL